MAGMAIQRRGIPGRARPCGTCVAIDLPEAIAGRLRNSCARDETQQGVPPMMDILMLALAFGFFALAIGYTFACERL